MADLLPCPFCGDTSPTIHEEPGQEPEVVFGQVVRWPGRAWVECEDADCGIRGPSKNTREEAIVAWNTRPVRMCRS